MPDVPLAPDEAAALHAANARLRQVIQAKDTEIAVLREQVEALTAQVAELRARLGNNSRNSSKPPSAEGLAKSAPRSLRKKTGRKPGRPKGQPGVTLELTDHPGEVVTHEPGSCAGCGNGLFGAEVTATERRQVIDLPEDIQAVVTELPIQLRDRDLHGPHRGGRESRERGFREPAHRLRPAAARPVTLRLR
jgi:hypothetical protein